MKTKCAGMLKEARQLFITLKAKGFMVFYGYIVSMALSKYSFELFSNKKVDF